VSLHRSSSAVKGSSVKLTCNEAKAFDCNDADAETEFDMPLSLESIEEARLIRAMLHEQGKTRQEVATLLQDMARVCDYNGRIRSAEALREVACEQHEATEIVPFQRRMKVVGFPAA
jgi:hypothetical protein